MKKYTTALLAILISTVAISQPFEGGLRVEYKDETGKANNADVLVKGDKYYINRTAGGVEKYRGYILDVKAHSLTCLSDKNPKTAITFNTDRVLALYEKNNYKPGYRVHEAKSYKATGSTKKIGEVTVAQKKLATDSMAYELWSSDIKVDCQSLIPVLRIAGFWNKLEDGQNAILEGKTTNIKTTKSSTIKVTVMKSKADDKMFDVPKDYQVVDLNRFIAEQAQSPKLGDLVRGFAGF